MVSLRVRPSPLGETEIVTLYRVSHNVCASRWFPSGNERMTEKEGGREKEKSKEGVGMGGEEEKKRKM